MTSDTKRGLSDVINDEYSTRKTAERTLIFSGLLIPLIITVVSDMSPWIGVTTILIIASLLTVSMIHHHRDDYPSNDDKNPMIHLNIVINTLSLMTLIIDVITLAVLHHQFNMAEISVYSTVYCASAVMLIPHVITDIRVLDLLYTSTLAMEKIINKTDILTRK